ncbi:MAG: NIPSNAP family protein [Pseudomonadota bacterium]
MQVGRMPDYVKFYETERCAIQKPILGRLAGYLSSDIGALLQIVHLWAYRDQRGRAERRARLAADPRWQAYLKKVQPMQISQRNDILLPSTVCPDHLTGRDADV